MFGDLLRKFARENFGADKYFPVLHGETTTTKPLALVIKRPRSIWKRPFAKYEITTLDLLEKYIVSDCRDTYVDDLESKLIQEEVLIKEKNTPAKSRTKCDLDVGEIGGVSMEQEDEIGDLVLGKLSQVFITDPDLRDILSNTVLDPNKMSCFENEELLLIYSVIYSEKLEVQDERERKKALEAHADLSRQFAKFMKPRFEIHYDETTVPPGVSIRNEWGPILFKCCHVDYNEENSRLEIKKGEFVGKLARGGGDMRGTNDDPQVLIGLDTDETDFPDLIHEDLEKLDKIKENVLMTARTREQRQTLVGKYLGWFEQALKSKDLKLVVDEKLTSDDCKFLRSICLPAQENQMILDLTELKREQIQGYAVAFKVLDNFSPEQWTELEETLKD